MKLVIIIIFSSLCGYIIQSDNWKAPATARLLENPIEHKDEKSIIKGKKIYGKLCWSCHGVKGEGNGPASVDLNPKPVNFKGNDFKDQSDGEIMWKISNGKGKMPIYKDLLTEIQRWQLVTYLRSIDK